jgi:hypothetical protein
MAVIPNFNIDVSNLQDKRFKIRKIQYNTYEVHHSHLKGQLRLIVVPTVILQLPKEVAGPSKNGYPSFIISTQAVVGFASDLQRKLVSPLVNDSDIAQAKKIDITSFIISESSNEPWNEFIIAGSPLLMIRAKTILTRLEWVEGHTDSFGGPILSVNHNTTHSVTDAPVGEAGMV